MNKGYGVCKCLMKSKQHWHMKQEKAKGAAGRKRRDELRRKETNHTGLRKQGLHKRVY